MNPFENATIALIADGHLSNKLASAIRSYPLIVAVDNGLNFCDQFDLKPSLIIGDFDSVSKTLLEKYKSTTQIHDPDCNTTDLEKALNFLQKFHPEKLIVYGATGKRLDHTLTNLCLLSRFCGKVVFETEQETLFCIDKKASLTCSKGQTISLIPLNGEVKGITTRGLKWELENAILSKNFVGISNVAMAENVEIQCAAGDLLVCINH
jgi:thiamine pyrophosphokinase